MEHYRSTLAVTAAAVLGLIAVAHSLHPGNFEQPARAGRVIEVAAGTSPAATVWTDPPRRLRGSEPAELMEASADLLSDHPVIVLPADARMAPRLSSTLVAPLARDRNMRADPIGDLIRGLDRGGEG